MSNSNFNKSIDNLVLACTTSDYHPYIPKKFEWDDTIQTSSGPEERFVGKSRNINELSIVGLNRFICCSYLLYSPKYKEIKDQLNKEDLKGIEEYYAYFIGELRAVISDGWAGFKGDAFKYLNPGDTRTWAPFELGKAESFIDLLNKIKVIKNPDELANIFKNCDLMEFEKDETQLSNVKGIIKYIKGIVDNDPNILNNDLINITVEQFSELLNTGNIKEYEGSDVLEVIKNNIKNSLSIYKKGIKKYLYGINGKEYTDNEIYEALEIIFSGKKKELEEKVEDYYSKINVPTEFKDARDLGNTMCWYGPDYAYRYGVRTIPALVALTRAFRLKCEKER